MEGIHLKLMKMLKRRLFEMGVLDMATRKKKVMLKNIYKEVSSDTM
jgi:hypothetical protein